MIHVVIPHYRCHHWLAACLRCLYGRQSSAMVRYTVVSMDDTIKAIEETKRICDGKAEVLHHDAGEAVGGMALPAALTAGTLHNPEAITVTVDPDALVLRDKWDVELVRIFNEPKIVAAGINPRSHSSDFAGVPEWNWMAFRTEFWGKYIGGFSHRRIDIGHLFKDAANAHGRRVFTWPWMWSRHHGRAAAFTGDAFGFWAFHAFYSSRRRKDYIPPSEVSGMLSPEQEEDMIRLCVGELEKRPEEPPRCPYCKVSYDLRPELRDRDGLGCIPCKNISEKNSRGL